MVDVADSKSAGGDSVWVRVPPPAPRRSKLYIACSDLFYKSERAHAAAPPFQIEPAALGFDFGFFLSFAVSIPCRRRHYVGVIFCIACSDLFYIHIRDRSCRCGSAAAFLTRCRPPGGGLSTEAECGIIGGKTGPDTGKGVTDAVLSLYLATLESDGDKKQFRELYRRYHRVMERTALAVLHDPHDAEEAVQEAFLRVIEDFSKIYEIPCKDLGGWLVIIVRNEAITILRRRRCHLPLEEGWADFAGQSRDLPDYSSMVQLFARLPDTYRAVLEMKLVLGWSTAEIARRLGLTESAVNTRLSRGRALLRKIFEEEGIEP